MKKASKLTNNERSEIQILNEKGYTKRSIARALGRSPNTISEEIKRNSCGTDDRTPLEDRGKYIAAKAKQKAYVRRKQAKYQGKKIQEDDRLRLFIVKHFKKHWNPDEIAGHMKAHAACIPTHCRQPDDGARCSGGGIYASKTAIYEWLRSARGQRYCIYLYSKRYRKKPRKPKKTARQLIPDRVGLENRPNGAMNRTRYGHWEQDAIVSRKNSSSAALAVMQERKSRYLHAVAVGDMRPDHHTAATKRLTGQAKVLSITYDNGVENRHHTELRERGVATFFTDPYSSWQKGSVENANKMLRRYFPKGTDFSTITQTDVNMALTRINNKPRKILGYRSALQIAKEKGVIIDRVS